MLVQTLVSFAFCMTLVCIMLLPALVAAYGEKFVDVVSTVSAVFFLPIKKIREYFLTKVED